MAIFAIVSEQGPSKRSVLSLCGHMNQAYLFHSNSKQTRSGDSYTTHAELQMKNITFLYVFVYWHPNDADDIQYF